MNKQYNSLVALTVKEFACNVGDLGSIPGSGRSPGGEHGSPLQYSCLENPHGQRSRAGCSPRGLSRTRLSDLAQHSQRKKSALLGMVVTQMNARFKTHFTIHLSYVRFAFYTSKKKKRGSRREKRPKHHSTGETHGSSAPGFGVFFFIPENSGPTSPTRQRPASLVSLGGRRGSPPARNCTPNFRDSPSPPLAPKRALPSKPSQAGPLCLPSPPTRG